MTVVQTLGPISYCGFMEKAGEGRDAYTHKALVRFHDTEVALDSYVKIYCQNVAPKALVNEVVGYILAKRCGLDTPQRAAFLLLDDSQVGFLPPHMQPLRDKSRHVICWCVQSLGGKTPAQAYSFNLDPATAIASIRQDFKGWKELVDVVSLDAWVFNEDRNLGNLVRLGSGRYAVIDHGRVLTGNAWGFPLEPMVMKQRNMLAHIAWDNPDLEAAPSDFHIPVVEALSKHSDSLIDAAADLDYWLSLLVSSVEKADAEIFLDKRTQLVRDHYKAAYGILLP